MNARDVLISSDADAAAERIASDFIGLLSALQSDGKTPRIVLTGGSLGIELLRVTAAHPLAEDADWSNVQLYWGDERWLPAGDGERNDQQALEGFLQALSIPESNIHRAPANDGDLSIEDAATQYSAKISAAQHHGFDLVFLGVGPDGHVASLFPNRPDLIGATGTVIPVRNSPKPPPERLSLTLPTLNSAERVWLLCTGEPKGEALARILSDSPALETPAAAVRGRKQTRVYTDRAAADKAYVEA